MASLQNPTIIRRIYTGRDYDSFKERLIYHLQEKFPATFNDLHEGHIVSMIIELCSKLSDEQMFFLEHYFNELFIDTCGERRNMTSICKLIDYRMRNLTAATVLLDCTCDGYYPYILTIPKGTLISTRASVVFYVKQDYTFNGETSFQIEAMEGSLREDLYTSNGKTNQVFYSSFDSVADNAGIKVLVDDTEWEEVDTLWDIETGNYYERDHTSDLKIKISFGDNVHGNIPPSGASIKLQYGTCSGLSGNIAKAKIDTSITGEITGGAGTIAIAVNNTENAASGGDTAESVDEARINAPLSLKAVDRLITADDYKGFALKFPGVLAASVAIDNILNLVTVYIVGNGYTTPTPSLIADLKTALQAERVVGLVIDVQAPTFVKVDLGGEVIVKDNYALSDVKVEVEAALKEYFEPEDPLASQKDFGQHVRLSDVIRLIDEQEGVDYVNLERLSRLPTVQLINWHSTTAEIINLSLGTTAKQEIWTLKANTLTKFSLIGSVSGYQTNTGHVNIQYNSDEGQLGFTLSQGVDELEAGDLARIQTSAYLGNLRVAASEFVLLGNMDFSYRYERFSTR